jgi:hypothetical protein
MGASGGARGRRQKRKICTENYPYGWEDDMVAYIEMRSSLWYQITNLPFRQLDPKKEFVRFQKKRYQRWKKRCGK